MALIACGECDHKVSTTAKTCPSCGAKVKVPKAKTSKGVYVALIVVVFAAAGILQNQKRDLDVTEQKRVAALNPAQAKAELDAKRKSGEFFKAQYACNQFVKASLHDAASAELTEYQTWPVANLKNGIQLVTVTGTAKNGFNAVRKVNVGCTIKTDSKGDVALISLKQR